ncbi:universal stress protein PHOS32-like [Impatiens glandulifera]|uniref:universal stress protein PHOS32-like n=1 Tax=Impatiens glandulifera TaxID=253017 RepID=UPI001FB1582B|nr:universal stress protein PHOS32-like [Impatiens glandulifera]
MGGPAVRMPTFCLNRMKPRARVRSPTTQTKPDLKPSKVVDNENDCCGLDVEAAEKGGDGCDVTKTIGRRIMIVVDSSMEAKGAVNWALTHTIQSQDTVILIHVSKPSKRQGDEIGPRMPQFLQSMKNMCQLKRPEVQFEATVTKSTDKGPTIVEQAKKLGVDLLVLGQKKRSTTWRLLLMWMGNRAGVAAAGGGGGGGAMVEYCIQNATCMAIAVRRKSKKAGGYLITTKRHKDFWLLA